MIETIGAHGILKKAPKSGQSEKAASLFQLYTIKLNIQPQQL